jgi:GH24 family phage-related lysozyme (muramidase)|tara:strand:- start:7156 stop:7611 length:456 start_codon:yes stop_codon:yes gene_type:complete
MDRQRLMDEIKRHEGEVLEIYEDSLGYLTFGVGHLIKDSDDEHGLPVGTPVSQERVDDVYDYDFDKHLEETIHLFESKGGEDFYSLPENIQHVLVNMTFNLGGTRFGKFNNMWKGVVSSDWEKVAVEMEDSKWFRQVGRRSVELQEMVRNA